MNALRDPEATRAHLLEVAAEEFRARGYEGASLSDILARAGVSKGGLYHHFASKQALGYAVFDEILVPYFFGKWQGPLSMQDPIQGLYELMTFFATSMTDEQLAVGCPMNKMATELGQSDDGIRDRAQAAFNTLREQFCEAFSKAKERELVAADTDTRAASAFIVASIQGLTLQGQHSGDMDSFRSGVLCLANYILSLKGHTPKT
ncbi:TetR/AcrR family transcriptional regulator [Teredinibacter franksiae]|uniref:TetR/AcrR family transcriptional regulator n=1 Tax=Teredinibacter franksiae TaxID=2761453 RepID=UPI001629AF92|nr:TetR/AcrR family transcriptional regulator [Teredinibacter franksiae]